MSNKSDDILFLIGAGCSYEAGIPISDKMVELAEERLKGDWNDHDQLYKYLKNTIIYGNSLIGKDSNFNIEDLLTLLNELEKNKAHILFPFIMGWGNLLTDLAGKDFEKISKLKKLIIDELPKWVTTDDYGKSKYYKKLFDFQKKWQFPLRIFSLNYDQCIEKNCPNERSLEQGFNNEKKVWNADSFYSDNAMIKIYLYKLHGSIAWYRDKGNVLKLSEHPGRRDSDLIFGTDFKLQSIDPYLFYVHEFRKYSLESELIIIIGYSFSDEYVNNLLKQALEHNSDRKILCVHPIKTKDEEEKKNIKKKLKLKEESIEEQIVVRNRKAKEFLENDLSIELINNIINKGGDEIF